MGITAGPGVGARASIEIAAEATYGVLVSGLTLGTYGEAIPFKSESIKQTIKEIESAELNPQRGIASTIQGSSDIAGDVATEFAAKKFDQLMKHAVCSGASGSANYISVPDARADLGMQIMGTQLGGAVLVLQLKGEYAIFEQWPIAGTAVVINRLENGNMVAYTETYAAKVLRGPAGYNNWHTLTVAALASSHLNNAWIFPVDAVNWNGAVLHYFECGKKLPIGMNFSILRDIALFDYTGMKVNTMAFDFAKDAAVAATFGMIGREEICGGRLLTEITYDASGATALSVSDIRTFNDFPGATSMLMIGHEGEVYYTTKTPTTGNAGTITTTGNATGAIVLGEDMVSDQLDQWAAWPESYGYFKGRSVVPQTTRANNGATPVNLQSTIPDIPAFACFDAGLELMSGLSNSYGFAGQAPVGQDMGGEFIAVMSAKFTLDNQLFTDKFEMGDRFRKMLPEQQRKVTGSLNFELDNLEQYRAFLDRRVFAITIRCVLDGSADNQLVPGCLSDVPYSTVFYFRRCQYTGDTPTVGGQELIMTDMPFRAMLERGALSGDGVVGGSDYAVTDERPFNELTVFTTTDRATNTLWA